MNTYISSNIKKVSERIDPDGNIINKDTKQIIEPKELEFIQPIVEETPAETPKIAQQTTPIAEKIQSMVNAKLEAKINEIVDKQVADILSKM